MAQPDAPKEADFDSYAEFTAAASYHVTQSVLKEHTARTQVESAVQREVSEIQQTAAKSAERLAKRVEADPAFADRIDPRLLNLETASVRRLKGEPIGPQHVLAEQVMSSEAVDALLEHFSTPNGQREWRDLLGKPPADLLRAFGRIEARLEGATGTQKAAPAPAPKTLSTAPAPKTQLGQRPQEAIDPADAAIGRGDYAAYEAAENAKATAGLAAAR